MEDIHDPALDGPEAHHLLKVLRLRPGEAVMAADGLGTRRLCVLSSANRLEPVEEAVTVPRPTPAVAVGFSLLKGDRNAWVVQKLTELGVDRIVPVITERVVKRPKEAGKSLHERLSAVSKSAFCQARLDWLPKIDEPREFSLLARTEPVVCADADGGIMSTDLPLLVVGPEGGWSPGEKELTKGAVRLGEHTLRSETAAVVAGALLCALRAGIVLPSHLR